MSEQQVATELSKCPHPEAVGERWGDPISEERQAELEMWIADHQDWMNQPPDSRYIPCSQLRLTGADIFWFFERAKEERIAYLDALIAGGQPFDTIIRDLRDSDRFASTLHLEGADLFGAHLEGAFLAEAHLEDARLHGAHLEGADLSDAHLEGADLSGALFDEVTNLDGVILGPGAFSDWVDQLHRYNRNAALSDIKWRGASLTRVPWEKVRRLGDEREDVPKLSMSSIIAISYRQVATQLRTQGLNDVADRFAHLAQTWQRRTHLSNLLDDWRRPWRWPGDLAGYLGSLFLAVLAGYGYKPGRTLFWYLVTVFGFMWGYLQVTHGATFFGLTEPPGTHPLHWYEALVLSLASFHGRGFFPQGISLGDPVAILAASEAVIGLFVEISFIATFTQRYFGGK